MAEIILVYITAGSMAEAGRIGRALVEDRLAVCVNIIPGMQSIYRWEGRIDEAAEVVLIAKTEAGRFPALAERVKALHSYEVPCILELPVRQGHPKYLDWIVKESADPNA